MEGVEPSAVLGIDEDVVGWGRSWTVTLPPRLKGPRNTGIERPAPRIIGLVLIEQNVSSVEFDVAPLQVAKFFPTKPFAREDAKEEAAYERRAADTRSFFG